MYAKIRVLVCFGFIFFQKFLDRSASFFGQETHEHVKTIKKRCLETKNSIFWKNAFKNRYVFQEGFPPGAAATHRRVFCLEFLGMFRVFGNVGAFFEYSEFF